MKKQLSRAARWVSFVLILGLLVMGVVPHAQAQVATPQACGPKYTVQRGEWLTSIGRKCGVTLAQMLTANPDLPNRNLIYPGQVINVPVTGLGSPTATPTPTARAATQTGPLTMQAYSVQSGDTLTSLAARYNLTIEELVAANPNLLQQGETLLIPVHAGTFTATPTRTAGITGPTSQPVQTSTPSNIFSTQEPTTAITAETPEATSGTVAPDPGGEMEP